MTRLMERIKSESDPLPGFFHKHIITQGKTNADLEAADEVHRAYVHYVSALDSKAKAMSVAAFKRAMKGKCYDCIRANAREHRDKWVFRRLALIN